jgi:hypothetical protein
MGTLFVDKLDPQSGTSLEIGSSGDTITIPSGATITNSGTATGFGELNTPNFSVRGTANTSCADNTATKLSVGAEDWDSDSAFDLGSNNRFTVPSGEAGKYVFFARCYGPFTANVNFFEIRLYKNGSNFGSTSSVHENYNTHLMTRVVDASVGDYFEIYVRQSGSSSTQNVQLYEFSGFRISS